VSVCLSVCVRNFETIKQICVQFGINNDWNISVKCSTSLLKINSNRNVTISLKLAVVRDIKHTQNCDLEQVLETRFDVMCRKTSRVSLHFTFVLCIISYATTELNLKYTYIKVNGMCRIARNGPAQKKCIQ